MENQIPIYLFCRTLIRSVRLFARVCLCACLFVRLSVCLFRSHFHCLIVFMLSDFGKVCSWQNFLSNLLFIVTASPLIVFYVCICYERICMTYYAYAYMCPSFRLSIFIYIFYVSFARWFFWQIIITFCFSVWVYSQFSNLYKTYLAVNETYVYRQS